MRKIFRQYMLQAIICMIIMCVLFFWLRGIPLMGLPDADEISSVEILDRDAGQEPRLFQTRDKIDLASKIPGFLNYELGTPDKGEAVITVTYHKRMAVLWKSRPMSLLCTGTGGHIRLRGKMAGHSSM